MSNLYDFGEYHDKLSAAAKQERDKTIAKSHIESSAASSYKMRAITWFWLGRFALGKIGLIGGLPDKGKGLLSAYIAALGTSSELNHWPCKEGRPIKGRVLLLTAEDDIEDTVVPRLKAAGANLDMVEIINKVNINGDERMFNLATDLPLLERKIDELGNVVLIIIDPISAYLGVGKVNSSSTSDVRAILAPLKELAEKKRISVIGIMHFNKKADVTDAMLRISDSLAYVAAARHVHVVLVDPENKDARLFAKAKNNLARDKHALRFFIDEVRVGHDDEAEVEIRAPRIVWDSKHVEVTANEIMETEAGNSGRANRKDAEDFLSKRLAWGPVPTDDIEEEAKAHGISVSGALKRARQKLGVEAFKEEGKLDGRWFLKLPEKQSYNPE